VRNDASLQRPHLRMIPRERAAPQLPEESLHSQRLPRAAKRVRSGCRPAAPADAGLEVFLREVGRLAADSIIANYLKRRENSHVSIRSPGGTDRREASEAEAANTGKSPLRGSDGRGRRLTAGAREG